MRLASEAPFPYGYPGRICYFHTSPVGVTQIAGAEAMRTAVARAQADAEFQIYAAWPGEYRTEPSRCRPTPTTPRQPPPGANVRCGL